MAISSKPSSGIILLEPDPLHFFAALCILDWTPVFETEKLIIALNCPLDQIIPLCATFAPSKDSCRIDYSLNPAFVKHDEEYFGLVKKLLDRNISKDQINRNTLKKFGIKTALDTAGSIPITKKIANNTKK